MEECSGLIKFQFHPPKTQNTFLLGHSLFTTLPDPSVIVHDPLGHVIFLGSTFNSKSLYGHEMQYGAVSEDLLPLAGWP